MNKAQILRNHQCKDCTWPIIACIPMPMFQTINESIDSIVWVYCSNKDCTNHRGQNHPDHPEDGRPKPEWIVKTKHASRHKDRTPIIMANWELFEKIDSGKLTTKSHEVKKFVQDLKDAGEYANGTVVVDIIRTLKYKFKTLKKHKNVT